MTESKEPTPEELEWWDAHEHYDDLLSQIEEVEEDIDWSEMKTGELEGKLDALRKQLKPAKERVAAAEAVAAKESNENLEG